MVRAARHQDSTAGWPCTRERRSWGWRRNATGGTGAPGGRLAPVPSARAERRTIVSESRVHVSDETEDAPVTDGEVGEAGVFGEVDEPEEPYEGDEADEAGEFDSAGVTSEAGETETGAEDADDTLAADDTGDGAEDGAGEDGAGEDGAGEDGAGVLDPVARYTEELRRLPGEWYVVHSYAGYENRVKANLESRMQSLNMED